MYYGHFGLNQAPFKITPNTGFFFSGGNRGPILEALIYAVTHGEGIVKVTGEVGSGKTMLCNMLQARLPAHIETVYLANPNVAPEEILQAIAFELQLGVAPGAARLEVMHTLQEFLLGRHAASKRVVVFVEESQGMPLATLEEIRLLSNLETHNDKLLQIVLFGQPELDANLRVPAIRQLRERITHSFRLEPLQPTEVREYLMFRTRAAGYCGPDLFSSAVVKAIARASMGLTRRINIIADKALLAAFSENTHTIKLKHVAAAVRDSEFARDSGAAKPAPRWGWAAALVAVGAVSGAALYAFVETGGSGAPSVSGESATPAAPEAAAAVHEPSPHTDAAAGLEPAPAVQQVSAAAAVASSAPDRSADSAAPTPREAAIAGVDKTVPHVEKLTQPDPATVAGRPPSGSEIPPSGTGPAPDASARPANELAAHASTDPLAQRLSVTKQWLAQAAADTYSIQLMGTPDEAQLRQRLNDIAKFVDINDIFVYRTLAKGKPFLTVLYGGFKGRARAREALARLPGFLTEYRPILRTVRGIRAELAAQQDS